MRDTSANSDVSITLRSLPAPLATHTRAPSGEMARVAGARPTGISATTLSPVVSITVTESESGLTTHTLDPSAVTEIALPRVGRGVWANPAPPAGRMSPRQIPDQSPTRARMAVPVET